MSRWNSRCLDYDEDVEEAMELGAIFCELCGKAIYVMDDYYYIQNETLCEDCMNKLYKETNLGGMNEL